MKVWKCTVDSTNITYAIDYEDSMSFLNLFLYESGAVGCGYTDRIRGNLTPGAYYYETSWLDLLVVTGLTKEVLEEVKKEGMDAAQATQFLLSAVRR